MNETTTERKDPKVGDVKDTEHTHEEVLVVGPDWGGMHIFPVTLITYKGKDGKPDTYDIHRQTGENFYQDVFQAEKVLAQKGFRINHLERWAYGSTGAYCEVVKL